MDEESIFATALERTGADRDAFLDQACGNNRELRSEIDELLRSYDDAGSFLQQPVAAFSPTIAAGDFDTVDEGLGEIPLEFLKPTDRPGCLGTLAQYEVVDVVGRGGMGIVLRAYDTKLNRVVAIKVMAPELAANAMAVKRFLREARAAAAVSHDHVVTIHAIEEDNRPPFIVMEFIDGQSLQEKIDRTGGVELKEILRIGMQMARGLAAAHEQGLVHRDIKPADILLENGVERVKITDFGLARAVDDVSVTQTGQIAGTPQFMSPEQAQGQTLDARSDLFSLGSVLYTMSTGRPPFRAETAVAMLRRVTDDEPRSICEVNSDTPDWLESIIFKLLAKDPAERFQSAEEVAELLSRHLAHLQHPTTAPKPDRIVPPIRGAGMQPAKPGLAKSSRKPAPRRVPWGPIVAATLALTGCLAVAIVAGVVIFVRTNYGTIRVKVNDPNTTITIDDEMGISLQNADSGTLTVRAGEHKLHIQQGELEFETDSFRVKRGEDVLVRVELIDDKLGARLITPQVERRDAGSGTTFRDRVIGKHGDNRNVESVAIRTREGFYWRAVDGGGSRIMADIKEAGPTEAFKFEWQDDTRSKAWIRTRDGFYVCGILNRDGRLECTKQRGTSELFAVLWDRNQKTFRLRTRDGLYVHAPIGGGSFLDTIKTPGSSEVFTLVAIPEQRAWTQLFNGTDLTGWKTHPDQPGGWTVEDGVLIGRRDGRSHLFSERGDFEDFHVRAEAKINDTGNSGIFFRSGFGLTKGRGFPDGYEAQILNGVNFFDVGKPETQLTGSLYMLLPFTERLVQPNQWFTLEIIAQANHITIKVNGQTTADYVDAANTYGKRHIALQSLSHTEPVLQRTVVEFRKIELQDLTRAANPSNQITETVKRVRVAKRVFLSPQARGITSLAMTPDGKRVVAGGYNGKLGVWEVETGKQLHSLEGHSGLVHAVDVSSDGRFAVSGSEEPTAKGDADRAVPSGKIFVWDLQTGEKLRELNSHNARVLVVRFSPDDRMILTFNADFDGSQENSAWLWNAETAELIRELDIGDECIFDARFSPDGTRIAAPTQKLNRLLLLDVATGAAVHQFPQHPTAADQSAWSPDGRYLVFGHRGAKQTDGKWDDAGNCVLRMFDTETLQLVRTFRGHAGPITAVEFSPDGRWLLSAASGAHDAAGIWVPSSDQSVRLWDVATGEQLVHFDTLERINTAIFTVDGRGILTGGSDALRLWDVPVVTTGPFTIVDLQPKANQELHGAIHGNPDNDLREVPAISLETKDVTGVNEGNRE